MKVLDMIRVQTRDRRRARERVDRDQHRIAVRRTLGSLTLADAPLIDAEKLFRQRNSLWDA